MRHEKSTPVLRHYQFDGIRGNTLWVKSSSPGGVTSVINSDGTITISPTTGAVIAGLNLAHANTWTAQQFFGVINATSSIYSGTGGSLAVSGNTTAGLQMGSTAAMQFGNATGYATTKDVGIDRQAAGILEVNNGTTGNANGQLAFNGSLVTNLNASNIASGTISQARLPSSSTQTIASGAEAMPTGALAADTCSATATTVSVSGATATDIIIITYQGDPTSITGYGAGGGITIRDWPTAGAINFKLCNETSASVTPGALTVNWKIVR